MICIIGRGISSALEGKTIGGAEKQMALIAKGLKDRGLKIIVFEYHLNEPKVVSGVKFYPAWNKSHKSLFSKIVTLRNLLKFHKVDAVYARGTNMYIALLFLNLKVFRAKTKLFWGIAGDHDLSSKYNHLRVKFVSSIYAKLNAGIVFNISSILSFYFSDTIICQTKEQINRCEKISSKKSKVLISNIYSKEIIKEVKQKGKMKADALWIAKFSGNKGEDTLLKISQDIPEMKIICLGHVNEGFAKTDIFKKIERQKNLLLVGRVPSSEVSNYILDIDFILNTSPSEGLSNVFLEGWALKKPVISFMVNPNKYLSKGEAGYCANGSYQKLVLKLRCILNDGKFMRYHGTKGYKILINNHNSEYILTKYKSLFLKK